MTDQTNWSLLARYLSEECSDDDRREVQAWIESNPENQKLIQMMKAVWQTPEAEQQSSNIKEVWNEIVAKANIPQKLEPENVLYNSENDNKIVKRPFTFLSGTNRILRYAAIFLITCTAAYFFSNRLLNISSSVQLAEMVLIKVKNGDRQRITLPDGTSIIIDAGTEFQYSHEFDDDTREVF